MEPWRRAFREGFAPLFSDDGLAALALALETDDPRLIQGETVSPPQRTECQDWPVEAACLVAYGGWRGDELDTVAEVGEFFAQMCFEADMRLNESAGCRWFLNQFDDWPREVMRRELLPEVRHEQQRRQQALTANTAKEIP